MKFEENGYAVVSVVADATGKEKIPVVHCFKPTEWEAHAAERDVEELPENLRKELKIVRAKLVFELDT